MCLFPFAIFIWLTLNDYFVPWQFLFGSAHVMKQPLFQQACELAFAKCDVEGTNYCSEQEV